MARRNVLRALCAALVFSLAACGGGTDDSANDAIAFAVNRDGFGEIWVMDADGGNRVQLTESGPPSSDASGNLGPAWSPDRTVIAYTGTGNAVVESPHNREIYVMRADGSDRRRLTNDRVSDDDPAWSPDGERIAFSHTPGSGAADAKGVIVVMDADGGGRVVVTGHSGTTGIVSDSLPAWSPDGRLIAFTRSTFSRSGEFSDAIYIVDPAGGGEQLLIEDAAGPKWSPDGSHIVFSSKRDRFGKVCNHECRPSYEIYVAAADGTGIRRLTTSEADDLWPSWSPDGEHIAFASDRSNRDAHEIEIYAVSADGGDVRRLTSNDVWDITPAWR